MARTPTSPVEFGLIAPLFTLPDTVSGEMKSLKELKGGKATMIMFICNHCPYVKHVIDGIVELANDYKDKGISFIPISSNDVKKYPADSPENMKLWAEEKKFPFPYLYDESQEVAKAYNADCTPEFNIFDSQLKCVYRGQMDDSRPGNGVPVTGKDLRKALDALVAGKLPDTDQKPGIGCSIKWKE
jgi:peroxiredoxin